MSYDIFFVRRDPGQSFEDALEGVQSSYDGGDPGPLSEQDLELWEAMLPVASRILGERAELTQDDEETRELTDPVTGVGLTLIQGEFEIHVPENRSGSDDLEVMATVYQLARGVEDVTGLEGYDPQLGEPVSDSSDTSPTRRLWAEDESDDEDDDAFPTATSGRPGGDRDFSAPAPAPGARRWWQVWKP